MESKIAVVTGASSGIGLATARALAADGWHVVVAARRKAQLDALATEIGGTAIVLDITDQASVDAFVEEVRALGHCHLLVNNAGGAKGLDPVAEADLDDWEWMYQTNVLGTVRVTKALLPLIIADKGHIINMSSIAGITAYLGGAGYNAAKFGLSAMNKVLRMEMVDQPIRVSEINPGRVETDFSLVRFKGDAEKAAAVYADKLNLSAEDIAETVRWVAAQPAHVNIDRVVVTPRDQSF